MATRGPARRQHRSGTDYIPWGSGFGRGATAFLLLVGVMTLFMFIELSSVPGGIQSALQAPRALLLALVGFVYGSHIGAVPNVSLSAGAWSLTIPIFVYYLVPVVLLVWSGRGVVKRAGTAPSMGVAVAQGASVTVGYLAMALVGFVVPSVLLGAFSINSNMVQVALVAGVLYPAVLGSVGGAIAFQESGPASRQRTAARGQGRGGYQGQGRGQNRTQGQGRGGYQSQEQGGGRGQTRQGHSQENPTCPNCGARVQHGASYCESCGTSI